MQRRTYAQLAARIPNGIRHFFSWNPSRIRHFFLVESQESLGIPDFFFLWNPGIPESWNPGNMESWNPGIAESWKPRIPESCGCFLESLQSHQITLFWLSNKMV